jgi:hypothetical protein
MAENIEKLILSTIDQKQSIPNHKQFCRENNLNEQEVVGIFFQKI